MMPLDLAVVRRWSQEGTKLILSLIDGTEDEWLGEPCALPGWTRRHLVAHLAANADALLNLTHWASTGLPTPMYASPADRALGIQRGSKLPSHQLRLWASASSRMLETAMGELSDVQWQSLVRTATGRIVAASAVPWLRAREVWVHAVDLDAGVTFADLPEDFLKALCDDVIDARSGTATDALAIRAPGGERWALPGSGTPHRLLAALPDIAAWLTGRTPHLITASGQAGPELPSWL